MPRLTTDQLAAARDQALGLLGKTKLRALDDAGLIVVRRADLEPSERPGVRELHDVTLVISDPWGEPWRVLVTSADGASAVLYTAPDVVPGVREAVLLQRVMGARVSVEVDDADGAVTRVWTTDRD